MVQISRNISELQAPVAERRAGPFRLCRQEKPKDLRQETRLLFWEMDRDG